MKTASFPGILESLGGIAAFILEVAHSAGLDAHAAYRLRLAVDEVATNIISHGYTEAGLDGCITLTVRFTESALVIELEDTGAPYDAEQQELPTPQELASPLEERKVGGLGLFIVIHSVDDFRQERVGLKNKTTLIMHNREAKRKGGGK